MNRGIGIRKPCGCWVQWLSPATDPDYLRKRLELAALVGDEVVHDVDVDTLEPSIVESAGCQHERAPSRTEGTKE